MDLDLYLLYDTRGGTGPEDTSKDASWLTYPAWGDLVAIEDDEGPFYLETDVRSPRLTAVNPGSVQITAVTKDGGYSATVEVVVAVSPDSDGDGISGYHTAWVGK